MINSYKTSRYLFFIIPSALFILSFLFIRCSGKPKQESAKTKAPTQNTRKGKPNPEQDAAIRNFESDSLEVLLKNAKHDTIRLRILDAMAEAARDDEMIIAHNEKIENLVEETLAANPSDNVKSTCLKYLANTLHRKGDMVIYHGEFTQALEYFNAGLKLREEIGDTIGISNSYRGIGNVNYYLGDVHKAREYFERSLKLCEEIGFKNGISRSLNNIGVVYAAMDDIPKAREYYLKSLKIDEETGNKNRIATALNNIGITYSYEGDMPHALEYYSKCLKIKEELGDQRGISASLNNIATIYDYQKDFPAALEYLYRGLEVQEELGDKSLIPGTLTNIGNIYANQAAELAQQDSAGSDSLTRKALESYYRALEIQEEIGEKFTMAETLIDIGTIYDEQAAAMARHDKVRSDSLTEISLGYYNRSLKVSEEIEDKSSIAFALEKIGTIYLRRNEIAKALAYAKKSYSIAVETGYAFNIKDAAKLLDQIYFRQGNYKLSRQYFGEYISIQDSIVHEENQQLIQKKYFQYQYEKMAATDSIAHNKEMEIAELEIDKQKAESRRQKLVIGFVVIGLLLVLVLAGYIFRSLRTTRKQKNIIEDQKKLVDEKNTTLNEQNEEIRTQKEHIEHIHEALTDSIRYAERIQKAVLPSTEYINEIIADSQLLTDDYFILYKPRDIVSGDFYFFGKRKNTLHIAASDCTGHGVPGAFMSMLGISFLNQIIAQEQNLSASQILDELRDSIIHSLQQKGLMNEQKDGLDISFVSYDSVTKTLQFSGAYNPLYIISNDTKELTVIKADRMPVAICDDKEPFTNHVIQLQKGDIIYLATDGYQDQFGGPKGKKFYSKNLKILLTENCNKPMAEQKEILDETIEDWKNGYGEKCEQIDDITIVGIKIA